MKRKTRRNIKKKFSTYNLQFKNNRYGLVYSYINAILEKNQAPHYEKLYSYLQKKKKIILKIFLRAYSFAASVS